MSSLQVDIIRNRQGDGSPEFDKGLSVIGVITSTSIEATSIGIGSTEIISSSFELKNITSLDSTTLSTFESALELAPNTFNSLFISSGGISTFTGNVNILGITTVNSDLYVTGTLFSGLGGASLSSLSIGSTQVISSSRELQNITSLDPVTISTIENSVNDFNSLEITGISTFINGPVLIGSGTSTGTSSQNLQVTGGAYVFGNVGLGITNPSTNLEVVGNVSITGSINITGIGTIETLDVTTGTIDFLTNTNLTSGIGTIETLDVTTGTIDYLSSNNINAIGIVTATTFSGSGASLNSIPNGALDNSSVSYGGITLSLGGSDATPAFNLADATGLPVSTGISGLGENVATFLATPSSANLISAVTDETGTGALVFATSPTLITPVLGAASATNINVSGIVTTNNIVVNNHTQSGTLRVSGLSTFNGITEFKNIIFAEQDLFVSDYFTADQVAIGTLTNIENVSNKSFGKTLNIGNDLIMYHLNQPSIFRRSNWIISDEYDLFLGTKSEGSTNIINGLIGIQTGNNINPGNTADVYIGYGTEGPKLTTTGYGVSVTGSLTATNFIGIGTTDPTSKLSVEGDGNFTGIVTATTFSGNLQNTLTLNTSGTGLSGYTTFNNSGAATFTVASNATSANTNNTIVARDGSGNFSAGTITANLTGNSTGLSGTPNITVGVVTASSLTLSGDLTVNGTTTTLNTEILKVEDKNIELGVVNSPTNTTADGGGITLKGTTDKTFNWVNATSSWTSSENINLASDKTYNINETSVLSSNTLGSGVVNSSLTSVGTLTNLSVGNINSSGIVTATSFAGDGSNLTGISTFSGDYGDLTNIPVNLSDFNNDVGFTTETYVNNLVAISTFSGDYGDLTNIPVNLSDFNNDVGFITSFTDTNYWVETSAGIHTLSNVGVGTTNPTSALTVKGNTSLEDLNVSGVSTFTSIDVENDVNVVGVISASGGFISVGNTTPIQISLVGNELTFTAVGIGSTTLILS